MVSTIRRPADFLRSSWLDAFLQDSRFGVRMLMKHRGLTLIGAVAMAIAIAVGATAFEGLSEILNPALPFKGGERVVSLYYSGTNPGNPERRVLHDFVALRGQLKTLESVGAFQEVRHNLVASGTAPEPVSVAEITASGFEIAVGRAWLGRALLLADESPSAPAVLVLGYETWQNRFGGDPTVVGRKVQLGGVPRTIVGVMPKDFRFPVDHEFWAPLREDPLKYARWTGPRIHIFGRLAPGVTMEQAQAEFTSVASRTAGARPEGEAALRPRIAPYTRDHNDLLQPSVLWMMRAGQLLVGVLTLVVAINLAILVYARTVTRIGELAVRSALGASRRRILLQLFVEALVLATVGAGAGLGLARYGLDVIETLNRNSGGFPFWITFDLSPATVMYAITLALIASVVMGVLPGLKATGAGVGANLREFQGRGGPGLGATWTLLIVAQVAVAVAVLPAAVFLAVRVMRMELTGAGFPARSFAVANAELGDEATSAEVGVWRTRQLELMTRLTTEPGVTGVTFSSGIPGFAGERPLRFEDGARSRDTDELLPSVVQAGVDLFDTYGAEMLAGRNFTAADAGAGGAVVVNRSFARMYVKDANALGLRFRYEDNRSDATRWYQIVGIVRDFPAFPPNLVRDGEPTIYHPVAPGALESIVLSVRFAGEVPRGFIDRFRVIGAEVDPALQLRGAGLLSDRYDDGRSAWRSLAWAIALVTASVLLLSAAGIYALMSFTVSRRTREIGIRTALGAPPRRVMLNVLGRAFRQVLAGVLVGSVLAAAGFVALGLDGRAAAFLLLAVAAIMVMVGLVATLGPARRAMRIEATEALRADA